MRTLVFLAAILALSFSQFCDDSDCLVLSSPVCGSDGRTYFNECTLKKKACLEKSSLTVVSLGECVAQECAVATCPSGTICVPQPKQCVTTPCEQFACLSSEEAACSNTVCPQSTVCSYSPKQCFTTPCPQFDCDPKECDVACTMDYNPVCGSNFRTYSNQCVLESEACLTKTKITTIFNGECEKIVCDTMCTEEYSPVCGSNGRTYSNLCQLQSDSCLSKAKITAAKQGECECPEACTKDYRPVCGSDKVTYSNLCMLKLAACQAGSLATISLDYSGECIVESECPEMCIENFEPVCGSDGVTYSNECELEREKCRTKSQITKVQDGECNPPCPAFCAAIYLPVCGSDGKTHSNPCLLNFEACRTKTTITIVNDGECALMNECPEMCAEIYQPVCGIDLQTYSNQCSLNRENCLLKRQISVLHNGECSMKDCPEVCTEDFNPVCGSDGVTYGNLCSFMIATCKSDLKLKISSMGGCPVVDPPACNDMCAEIYAPVCGSDGITYENECTLSSKSCHASLTGSNTISMISKGECITKETPVSWEVMLKFDIDNDLLISRTEFDNFVNSYRPQSTVEEKDKFFAQTDLNGDNMIDQSEYKRSESIIKANSNPSKNNSGLKIGLGVGIGLIALVAVVAALVYKKRSNKTEEFNHFSPSSQPYNSLE